MRCLSTGFEVALRWLWGGFVLRSLCLVYAYYMALGWLWVACSPSWFKVRGSTFDVRRSACGRNFKRRKTAFRPSAVSLAYIARPGGGWSGPVTRDPDDTQRRADLAIALRRSALVPAMEGRIEESNRLRGEATAELRKSAFQVPAPGRQEEQAGPACPSMDEQFSEGTSLTPLKAGDLLIANRSSGRGERK